jgi:hypothetical protein
MSLQDDIVETVLDAVFEDEAKSTCLFKWENGYFNFRDEKDIYTPRELISKLIEIAEEKLNSTQHSQPSISQLSKKYLGEYGMSGDQRSQVAHFAEWADKQQVCG